MADPVVAVVVSPEEKMAIDVPSTKPAESASLASQASAIAKKMAEIAQKFSPHLQVLLPDLGSAFVSPRNLDLNELSKKIRGPGRVLVPVQEVELPKSAAEAKYWVVTNDLRKRTKCVKDVRQFGGRARMEKYFELNERLEDLGAEYKVSFSVLCNAFGQACGDISALERHLKGESVQMWNELEDLALAHPEDQQMYKCLVAAKGETEISKRRRYLGLAKEEGKVASGLGGSNGKQ